MRGEVSHRSEVSEIKNPGNQSFEDIKPKSDITVDDARAFFDNLFQQLEKAENIEEDNPEFNIEKVLSDYFKDLKEKSEHPDTIIDNPFDASDLKRRNPEENAEKRVEFDDFKSQMKQEWEDLNGRSWPKYENDVYSASGKLIRKAGSDYDAHHIQPLGMGGENVASNITPLNAEVHYDKQGVHAPDSPYSKLDQILGGMH